MLVKEELEHGVVVAHLHQSVVGVLHMCGYLMHNLHNHVQGAKPHTLNHMRTANYHHLPTVIILSKPFPFTPHHHQGCYRLEPLRGS